MTKQIKKIAVLTGGGDCPGLNAVIRSVTKTAIYQYGLDVIGIEDGFLGLVQNRLKPLTAMETSNILNTGGTILGTSNKCDPTRYRTAPGEPLRDMTDQCIAHLDEHEIDALVCIGGDGTMSCASTFVKKGVNCIGVPKTIDNDIEGTDVTFGFSTARYVATEALDRIHTTAASHHRAMIVEVMGRNAGWIALHAGIASGSDVILIPEIPYSIEAIGDYCVERSKHGKRFTILCVSEGAAPAGGEKTVAHYDKNSPDPIRLGGVGNVIAKQLEDLTTIETRCTVLGHVQRGGSPVPEDRILGTEFGHAAIQAIMAGKRNRLIVMKGRTVTDADILIAANTQRTVPLDHPLIAAAKGVGTSFGEAT